MSNIMHINGWIIQATGADGCIRVYPVNNDKIKQCLVQSNKHFSVADVVIVDDEAKQLSLRNEITIYHSEEVEVKKINN